MTARMRRQSLGGCVTTEDAARRGVVVCVWGGELHSSASTHGERLVLLVWSSACTNMHAHMQPACMWYTVNAKV